MRGHESPLRALLSSLGAPALRAEGPGGDPDSVLLSVEWEQDRLTPQGATRGPQHPRPLAARTHTFLCGCSAGHGTTAAKEPHVVSKALRGARRRDPCVLAPGCPRLRSACWDGRSPAPPRRSCACPHAPSLRVPGGGPRGRRWDLAWTVTHPEGLRGRPGGGLCLSRRELGALLRFGPCAPPAAAGVESALRAGAEVLRPRGRGRGRSRAGLRLGLRALPPPTGHTLSSRKRNQKVHYASGWFSVFQEKKHHRDRLTASASPFGPSLLYLTRLPCASSSQRASPAASALLWASSCLLSLASPSGALICRLGGPRRKCLGGFWTDTSRDKSHS